MQHQITIYPQAGLPGAADDTASVAGAVLTHNGTDYDLSAIPDGGKGEPSGDHPFVKAITRSGDVLSYGLRMIYDETTAVLLQTREDWSVTVEDADVPDLVERL